MTKMKAADEHGHGELEEMPQFKMCVAMQSDKIRHLHTFIDSEFTALEKSACQMAAGRALWCHVIHDPVAQILSGEKYLRAFQSKINASRLTNDREVPGVMLAVRTLWFDNALKSALTSFKTRSQTQLVLLGAGMDGRVYRLDTIKETEVYEVDLPRVIETKVSILEAAMEVGMDFYPKIRAKALKRVSADISCNDWFEKLVKAGFDEARSTVWMLEGLLYYLTDEVAKNVLRTIAERCSGEGVLIADFMNECSIGMSAELKSNFQFYSDWPEELLPTLGYSSDVRVSQIGDIDANFGLVNEDDALNFFNKLRRVPRCLKIDPSDGMPCKRLYLVQCSIKSS